MRGRPPTRRAQPRGAEDLHAFVVSWVSQCSFKPPMITVAMGRDSHGLALVKGAHPMGAMLRVRVDGALPYDLLCTPVEGAPVALPFLAGSR
mgnify:CR=1 FL=1